MYDFMINVASPWRWSMTDRNKLEICILSIQYWCVGVWTPFYLWLPVDVTSVPKRVAVFF